VPNVTLANGESGDLVLFIPNTLLARAINPLNKQLVAAAVAGAGAALPVVGGNPASAVAYFMRGAKSIGGELTANSGSNFVADNAGTIAMTAGAMLGGGSAAATTGGVLTVTFTASSVGIVFAPALIGGAAIYGSIRLVQLIKAKRAAKRQALEELAAQEEAKKRELEEAEKRKGGGCQLIPPPQDNRKPTGCGQPVQQPPVSTGCGDARPTPEKQKAGCGEKAPKIERPQPGCGSTDPVATANDLVLKRLLEEDVKNRIGWLLDKLGIKVPQRKLDHVTEGHIKDGRLVYDKPDRPKTLFDNEQDIPDVLVEVLENGETTVQGNGIKYEYDFGRQIGQTVDGIPLTKVRVIIGPNAKTGEKELITMYPIE
jgi:hypothetical protein